MPKEITIGFKGKKTSADALPPPATGLPISQDSKTLFDLPVDKILPNPYQPRKKFIQAPLDELAESIKTKGLLEPIVVAQLEGKYYLIAGERRLRASKLAGSSTIRAMLKQNVSKSDMVIMSLIENVQRENLTLVEEALAYDAAINSGEIASEAELARMLGKPRDIINKKRAIAFLSPVILEDLSENDTTSDYNSLSLLKKITDKEEQENIYKEFIAHSGSAMEKREWLRGRTNPDLAKKREETKFPTTLADNHASTNQGDDTPFDLEDTPFLKEKTIQKEDAGSQDLGYDNIPLATYDEKKQKKYIAPSEEDFFFWDCTFSISRELTEKEKKELAKTLQEKVDDFLAGKIG